MTTCAGLIFIPIDYYSTVFPLVCNYAETVPYQLSGYNPYDMRIKCEKLPLCYDFSNIEKYLNRDDVKEVIGAKGNWQSCNMLVNKLFMADFMTSFHQGIPDLLHDGLEVIHFELAISSQHFHPQIFHFHIFIPYSRY